MPNGSNYDQILTVERSVTTVTAPEVEVEVGVRDLAEYDRLFGVTGFMPGGGGVSEEIPTANE